MTTGQSTDMNDVLENRRLGRWAELLPRSPRQRGGIHESDAELVPIGEGRHLALTVDQVSEEVRAGLYRNPETIGRIAATSALSDLAAVGAEPLGLLLAVTLPAGGDAEAQAGIARGVADVAERARTFVLGGDTSDGDEIAVSCTAAGVVVGGDPVLRIGARPGDRVYASGLLGAGAALAASALLGGPPYPERDFRPALRLAEGRAGVGLASACMDTSDGLIATLDQLARLNGVLVRVSADLRGILCPAARRLCDTFSTERTEADSLRRSSRPAPEDRTHGSSRHREPGVGGAVPLRETLSPLAALAAPHGELELVTTVPPASVGAWLERVRAAGGAPIELGRIEAGAGLFVGPRALDGARLRNVWAGSGGDPRRALASLAEMCR